MFKVSDLPRQDQPENRLYELGGNYLTNVELLALIIGNGKANPIITSQKVLTKFKTLENILNATPQKLTTIKGIGKSQSRENLSLFRTFKKINYRRNEKKGNHATEPEIIFEYLKNKITDYYKEHLFVVSLDTRINIIEYDEVSTGTLTASLVHPRETFNHEIKCHAAQIIIAHNHPSGETEPLKIMGIEVLDHLIIKKLLI